VTRPGHFKGTAPKSSVVSLVQFWALYTLPLLLHFSYGFTRTQDDSQYSILHLRCWQFLT